MIKQLFSLMLSVCAAVVLMTACQDPAPEKDSVQEGETKTIPFCLSVKTEGTKVSYEGGSYSFKSGDQLHVVGVDRDDIEGYLTKSGEGNVWSGELTYLISKGEPGSATRLAVTLIHADNPDVSTYATAIVGAVRDESYLLRDAVELYSLFTTEVTLATTQAVLYQQATFLDVTVTFDFDGTHEIEAGKALVDLRTESGEAMAETGFVRLPEPHNEDFKVNFMAVVPGDKHVDDFTLTVGDRAITFQNNSLKLDRNKKYTITREVVYGPQLGDPFWSDGTYGRLRHPSSQATIVGIIVYVNHNYSDPDLAAIDDAITEKEAGFGHGLVMALKNVVATGGVQWSPSGKDLLCTTPINVKPTQMLEQEYLSGYHKTDTIITNLGPNAIAASLARNYSTQVVTGEVTTGWFLPSIGQWIYTISVDGFGGADHVDQWTNNASNPQNWLKKGKFNDLIRVMSNAGNTNNLLVKSLNDRLQKLNTEFGCEYDAFGMPVNANFSDNYWTSSEYDASNAFRMNLGSVEDNYATIKAKPELKTSTYFYASQYIAKVRPFLAF